MKMTTLYPWIVCVLFDLPLSLFCKIKNIFLSISHHCVRVCCTNIFCLLSTCLRKMTSEREVSIENTLFVKIEKSFKLGEIDSFSFMYYAAGAVDQLLWEDFQVLHTIENKVACRRIFFLTKKVSPHNLQVNTYYIIIKVAHCLLAFRIPINYVVSRVSS